MNLSSILFHPQFIPLSLLNGILVEVHLASASESFHYNPALETWNSVFDAVEGMFFSQIEYDAQTDNIKTAIKNQLKEFYQRPDCTSQPLEYEVRDFKFHASCIWMNAEYIKRLVAKATSDVGMNIFFNSYRFTMIPNEGSNILHINLTEQFQNLKKVFMVSLNKGKIQAGSEHSFNLFENFIKSYRLRIGARAWHTVVNTEPALSYVQCMQSLGMFKKAKPNTVTFTTYPRYQNVHIFDLEKIRNQTHSGEDTTLGRNLKLELEFNNNNDITINNPQGNPLTDANNNPLILKRSTNPSQCVVYVYQHFTKMMNISNKGIAVTD